MITVSDEQKIVLFDRARELSSISLKGKNYGYSDIGDILVSFMQNRCTFDYAMKQFAWLEETYRK